MRSGSRWGYKCFTLLVCALLVIGHSAWGQTYSFKHFGLDKSIFPSRIECLGQTHDGKLLIGTLAGLVVYDGFNFETIDVKNGLAESSVSALHAVDDMIYIGHWAGNISILDLKTDSIEHWPLSVSLDYSSIRQIMKTGTDSFAVITSDGKLYSVVSGTAHRVMLPQTREDEKVCQLVAKGSNYYVLTDRRILARDNQDVKALWTEVFETSSATLVAMLHLNDEKWTVATEAGLLLLMESVVSKNFTTERVLHPGMSFSGIVAGGNAVLWASTADLGVLSYDLKNDKSRFIKRENGLSYNQVRALFCDREENIWIATSAGLDQFLGDAFVLFDQRKGVSANLTWDVEQVGDKIFAATKNALISGKLNVTGEVDHFFSVNPVPDMNPRRLLFDGSTILWILDAEGEVWKHNISDGSTTKPGLKLQPVNCFDMVDGSLWLGTDEGVYVVEGDNVTEHMTAQTGLAGNKITGIYYSRVKNETWITALGSPATLYRAGKFSWYGAEEGLTSGVIQHAAFDRNGNIWFATYDKGVFWYDDSLQFQELATKVALTSTTTFAIDIDEQGVVWIGHNWGVDAYNPALNEHNWYGEVDGFMGVEVNAGAIVHSGNRGFWMGTLMGLLHFNPSAIAENEHEPSLYLTKARLGSNNLLNGGSVDQFLTTNSDLYVEFESVSLTNPERNTYHYRLRGIHENWKSMSQPEAIEYLSLPAGNYTFEIKACNNSGFCTTDPIALKFQITPPFYKTWWFYTLLFLVVVAAIFFMDRYRVVNLLEQKLRIEEKLAHREQEISEMEQEKNRLATILRQEMKLVGALEQREQEQGRLATEVLEYFNEYKLHTSEVSSDGVFAIFNKQLKVVLLVDVGITGMAAHAIKLVLKHAFEKQLPTKAADARLILTEWKIIVRSLEQTFGKFKGVNWFMYQEHNNERYYSAKGMYVFTIGDSGVEEYDTFITNQHIETKQSDLLRISPGLGVMVCTDGLFNQLNEAGTKNYPKQRLIKLLEQHGDKKQASLAMGIINDFNAWKGSMEQSDDLTIFIWNYA